MQCGNYHKEVSWCVVKFCGCSAEEVISSIWGGDIDMTRRLDQWNMQRGSPREEQEHVGNREFKELPLTHPSEWDKGTFSQDNSSIITDFPPKSAWKN